MKPSEYFNSLEPGRKKDLSVLRKLIKEEIPGVKETMEYKMPSYELNGTVLFALASQKNYMSLYCCERDDLLEKHKKELSHLNNGKSCIRFKKIEDLPLNTVRKILRELV